VCWIFFIMVLIPKNVLEATAGFPVCSMLDALGPPRLITNVWPFRTHETLSAILVVTA